MQPHRGNVQRNSTKVEFKQNPTKVGFFISTLLKSFKTPLSWGFVMRNELRFDANLEHQMHAYSAHDTAYGC